MYSIQRSALFHQQFIQFVKDYKERAGVSIANNFIDGVEKSTDFIADNPQACILYTKLNGQVFRKWRIPGFPHSIFFRMQGDMIILEALYAHKMDTIKRLSSDIND